MRFSLPALALALLALPAAAHFPECNTLAGVGKARCERHMEMYRKCGELKGDEHFRCDRAFLLANPLQCTGFAGEDATRCAKEIAAFQSCEPNAGMDFMKCVRKTTGESPMGH